MASKYHFDIEQGSEEWLALRKWKLTGSHAQAIWNIWKGLETYTKKICAEFFSSGKKESYSNEHIERWHELEPQAREIYSLKNMCDIQQVGFIELNEFVWTSPDGLVWDEWLVEIKSQDDEKHFSLVINWPKEIDSWYIWQMQMNLWISERKWCDFISYNPNYEKSLFVHRVHRDEDKIQKLQDWCVEWIRQIKELKKIYESQVKK